jgi:hypothetical protein
LGLNNNATLPKQWEQKLTKQTDLDQAQQAQKALEIAYQKKVAELNEIKQNSVANSTFIKDLVI